MTKIDGDKLITLFCSRSLKKSLAALIIALFAQYSAAADQAQWTFENSPHPTRDELTDAEHRQLDAVSTESPQYFEQFLKTAFDIYNHRYPQYADTGKEAVRFEDWQFHVTTSRRHALHIHVINNKFLKLMDILFEMGPSDLKFCGVYSRSPQTERELEFVALIDAFVSYAKAGSQNASSVLLTVSPRETYALNKDVAYFLHERLKRNPVGYEREPEAPLKPHISPERLAFLEDALQKDDFGAVLATTEPCATSSN